RREKLLEIGLRPAVQLTRLEGGAEERDVVRSCGLDHCGRNVEPLRDDHGRDVEAEEGVERRAETIGWQGREERDLGLAEDLDPAVGQAVGVAGEDETGAGQVRFLDDAIEPGVASQQLEREALLALLEEFTDRQPLHLATMPFWNESSDFGVPTECSRLRSCCRRSRVPSLDRT